MKSTISVSNISNELLKELLPQYEEQLKNNIAAVANEDGRVRNRAIQVAEVEALRVHLERFTVHLVQRVIDEISVRESSG
ncbi:hypothetical protein [Paenibacillus koleovorans]|uniref:hypothetical protein n=1 Tax=Paenibacillus koleovorans TaxID=121608 RepID=UPI000FD863E4|nr:hypothetical protein [Paenibacillus koleovorans]